jgi:hypothetical protein
VTISQKKSRIARLVSPSAKRINSEGEVTLTDLSEVEEEVIIQVAATTPIRDIPHTRREGSSGVTVDNMAVTEVEEQPLPLPHLQNNQKTRGKPCWET